MDTPENGWYRCRLERRRLKQLMRRTDADGLLRFGSFLALVAGAGWLALESVGAPWAVPAFLLYGTLFAFGESAAHELSHGTVFRRRWLNEAAYWIACFMSGREPIYGRYRHARHHTFTSLRGLDPEGAGGRPRSLGLTVLEMLLRIQHNRVHGGAMLRHCFGIIDDVDRNVACIPESEHAAMCRNARIMAAAQALVVVWSVAFQTWLPVLLLLLPRCYGTWLHDLCSRTQHDGLASDVKDHRLTTRTILLGPVLRFLYWNMNYHIEHHMHPTVPFHALPALREAIRDELPPPSRGLRGAWREILPALIRQRKDPGYHLVPKLPEPPAASPAAGAPS